MDTTRIATTPFTDAERDWSTPRTLREATQEFEGLFIAHMMQTMRRSVPGSKLLGSGSGQTIFREMLDQELSRQIAHSGGFVIGEMLYQELAAPNTTGRDQRPAVSSPIGPIDLRADR